MHVTIIGPYPFPNTLGRGGVERVIQVLRQHLAWRIQVSLIVPNARDDLRHTDELGQVVYLKRTKVPGFLTYWSLTSRAVLREVHRLAPDIVHVHDAAGIASLWPPDDAVWSRAVFTAHGVLERDIRESPGPGRMRRATALARSRLTGFVERKSRPRFKDIILINQYLLHTMTDLKRARLHYIVNPVDQVFLDAPARKEASHRPYALLQVGMVSPLKNVLGSIRLVQALKRSGTQVHLDVIGPAADQGYAQVCRAAVEEADLSGDVTFHGEQPPKAIAAWMDSSDALILLSKQEVAPVVVAEAHCRGLPTFARAAFGLPWMVREGENGILLAGSDPVADAQKVNAALKAQWDRIQIREHAVALYHPDAVATRTINAYREILSRHHSVASPAT